MKPSLQDAQIALRALEPEDIEPLMRWENDEDNWPLSGTLAPYSRHILRQYVAHSKDDIYSSRQLRLIIEHRSEARAVGTIDLFDFDPFHLRAGVGILIGERDFRRQGLASRALSLITRYGFHYLGLMQLYCTIGESNRQSQRLFEKQGFTRNGTQQKWIRLNGRFQDAYFYQLLNPGKTA